MFYDAEHFFDGYKANREDALATIGAAAAAGAEFVILCETNGGVLPWEVEEIVRKAAAYLSEHAAERRSPPAGADRDSHAR